VHGGQANGQVNGHTLRGAARPLSRSEIPKKNSWVLPGAPAAVARARLVTRETMVAWGAGDDTDVEDVVLMVDELVTNAVVHGCGPVTLVLRVEAGTLVGEVGDHAGALPDFAGCAGEGEWGRESGRGLWLVAMLAADHGVRRETAGKTLWFTRALTP
jgi:anti-sigma regulatory factor (Ser/Thr protein kinase)